MSGSGHAMSTAVELGLGFRVSGFKKLGVSGLGFQGLGFRGLGFTV